MKSIIYYLKNFKKKSTYFLVLLLYAGLVFVMQQHIARAGDLGEISSILIISSQLDEATIVGEDSFQTVQSKIDKIQGVIEDVGETEEATEKLTLFVEIPKATEGLTVFVEPEMQELILEEDRFAAQNASDLIFALPAKENLTLDNVAQVEEARLAYKNLTETQKNLVSNYSVLITAEGQINILMSELEILDIIEDGVTEVIEDGVVGEEENLESGEPLPEPPDETPPEPLPEIPEPITQTNEDGSLTVVAI